MMNYLIHINNKRIKIIILNNFIIRINKIIINKLIKIVNSIKTTKSIMKSINFDNNF